MPREPRHILPKQLTEITLKTFQARFPGTFLEKSPVPWFPPPAREAAATLGYDGEAVSSEMPTQKGTRNAFPGATRHRRISEGLGPYFS